MLKNLPYEMQWRIDEHGTPCSVALEETVVVSKPYLNITLEEIPDSYQRVVVTDVSLESDKITLGEVMSQTQVKGEKYFVDYNNGVVYFAPELVGKVLQINYYGRGFKLIRSSRIVMEDGTNLTDALKGSNNSRVISNENDNDGLKRQIDLLCDVVRKQQKQIDALAQTISKIETLEEYLAKPEVSLLNE